jgi:amidase
MSSSDREPAFRTALELAADVRSGKFSAEELLDYFLARVERFNPDINAIVVRQDERARDRARAADKAMAEGKKIGPLHGVPMTVKESYDLAGTPSTRGNPIYRDNIAEQDALAVQRLEAAGAIVFGKTNVPLNLADWQSFNEIYGTCGNPWDLSRTPGGSSGGSAAALAAGLTGLEIGSDIGASIRNPAHYCGVFGHKPSFGIVPTDGHQVPGNFAATDITVCGPLARNAADLMCALSILASPSAMDATGWRLNLPFQRKARLKDFKVAVMLTDPVCAQDDELTGQLQNAVDALAKAGVQVDDRARPDIDMAKAQETYLYLLRAATGVRVSDEAFQQHIEKAASRSPADDSYAALVDRAVTIRHREWYAYNNERQRLRHKWAEFFQDFDLLLCPTAASAAFPHDQEGDRAGRTITINGKQEPTTDQLFWAGLSGMVYLPATVAPAGLTKSGLPCGLQIVAGYLEDYTAIEFARLVEREIGGFVAPPGYA